jgi:hypothetical protein
MSWMTRGGSSSVLGQSQLHFPLNELAQLARGGVASTGHEAQIATRCDRDGDGRGGPQSGNTTNGAGAGRMGKAVGKPPDEGGLYPSEGFG